MDYSNKERHHHHHHRTEQTRKTRTRNRRKKRRWRKRSRRQCYRREEPAVSLRLLLSAIATADKRRRGAPASLPRADARPLWVRGRKPRAERTKTRRGLGGGSLVAGP